MRERSCSSLGSTIAPHFVEKLLNVERRWGSAPLALDQGRTQCFKPCFTLLEQTQSGGYNVRSRVVPPLRDLPFNEVREMIANRD